VSIDVSGLGRLLGPARTIGEELRRTAAARGIRAHVAVAGTRMAAMVLALAQPGLTVIAPGAEADALASIHIGILEKIHDDDRTPSAQKDLDQKTTAVSAVSAFKRWGLKTLGDLAALPAADLTARLGRQALTWQAIARGQDLWPLVPTLAEERFESSLDLEWPIEDLEPLSLVLTRLLEPLSTRLERRDRGAAVLHVLLRLITRPSTLRPFDKLRVASSPVEGREPQGHPDHGRGATSSGRGEPVEPREICARRLELPSPIRDVRTLRTLALLDLEAHPPSAGIDRVTIVIDPTPGRVLQHTLFTRAHPTPEQISTLLARLGALMGADRFGAPATVDSYRPGGFAMTPFATDHDTSSREARGERRENLSLTSARSAVSAVKRGEPARLRSSAESASYGEARQNAEGAPAAARSPQPGLVSALRRCRYPVPARVAVTDGRPARVTTDRRGFAGGTVTRCAGPWRTSGEWWKSEVGSQKSEVRSQKSDQIRRQTSDFRLQTSCWDRDEWDLSLGDGAVYRVFRDRNADSWFIDAIVD
jgi:protein ImuB